MSQKNQWYQLLVHILNKTHLSIVLYNKLKLCILLRIKDLFKALFLC